jgi:hypothetical protein
MRAESGVSTDAPQSEAHTERLRHRLTRARTRAVLPYLALAALLLIAIVPGGLAVTVMVMVFVSRIAHHAVLEAVSGPTDSEPAGR